MAAAAYRHLARQMELPDLLTQADLVREAMATPGWEFVVASIAEHEGRMLAQLLHETTKPEEIPRLRGLVNGLRSMQEAADSIVTLAEERLRDAQRESARAQEHQNV
jgi:hypothetical protein